MKVKRRVDFLVERTDRLFRDTLIGGPGDDAAWRAIRKLRGSGSQMIFARAKKWCSSRNSLKRSRAASILAQLHRPESGGKKHWRDWEKGLLWRAESVPLVADMLRGEEDVDAIGSEIAALGHLSNPDAVPSIVPFANHVDANVRFHVACALGRYHDVPAARESLFRLMVDEDQDVRNCATFAIGNLGDADSPELRAAFWERFKTDPYFEVRCEAVMALAKREGRAMVPHLVRMFERCLYVPLALEQAAEELLEEGCSTRYWDAKDFVTALRAAYPEEAATITTKLGPN